MNLPPVPGEQESAGSLRGHVTVILPDRDVPIGVIGSGEEVVIWRDGSSYGAMSRQDRQPAGVAGRSEPQRIAANGGKRALPPSLDEPGFLRSNFHEAFERDIDDLAAMTSRPWTKPPRPTRSWGGPSARPAAHPAAI